MSENNYGALMLKSALDTSVDVTKIIAPGIYPVITGNASAPDSSAGLMTVVLTATSQKTTFQKESSSVVYSLINGKWKKPEPGDVGNFGTAAFLDAQTSLDDVTAGKLLVNGSAIAVRSSYAGNGGPIDDTNDLPGNAVSFVYGGAKNSPAGNSGSILDVSGFGGGYNIQLFANYTTGEILGFRTRNGDNKTWHKWNFVYHTGNKPTSTDVGALPITGGNLRGQLSFLFPATRAEANCLIANGDANSILACQYGYYQDRFDLHFYDEKGAWESNPLSIGRNGNMTVGGNLSGRAVFEGGIRVYSPNNPPPATDLSAYATQQWVGTQGYATQSWVLQNFVQNIDLTAPSEFQFWDGRGYMRPTDGAAMYNFSMVGGSSNAGWIQIRYTRKLVNNTWYVIN